MYFLDILPKQINTFFKELDFMKRTHKFVLFFRYFVFIFAIFCNVQLCAQNCTVNAGLDGGKCYTIYTNLEYEYDLFTLNGNSSGNINLVPNLLWELISSPTGAIVTFSNSNSNTTIVRAKMKELPSGIYIFRLGINCLSGERVYDSVTYTIKNICDFNLLADRSWSSMCGNSNDSIRLVGRPLRNGEVFRLIGRSIELINSNVITSLNADIYGPTQDSLRFTIKKSNADICTQGLFSLVLFSIKNGSCAINNKAPILSYTIPMGVMGATKLYISKTGPRNNVDTISCISSQSFSTNAYNICVKGGIGDLSDFSANFSVVTLSGSGNVSPTYFGSSQILNSISNRWDTVTRNTLHIYEVTYASNGCYPAFKDTIKIFFKSASPTTTGIMSNTSFSQCYNATDFPLTNNLKFHLAITGLIPANCKLVSSIAGPVGANVTVTNPYSTDTINVIGSNIISGQYYISTMVIDTITGCYGIAGYVNILFIKKATLPILRDTSVCLSSNYNLIIPYTSAAFASQQYGFTVLSGPPNNHLNQVFTINDSALIFSLNPYISRPGIYTIAAFPIIGSAVCNDARRDTFQLELISAGRLSNAGTDQVLLCNVPSTNLAGSLPGIAGFWKFLPAISINAMNAPIIADSSNRNTQISGFTNLSSNYFSWNVTDGNTGNYCNLYPDTVLVVFSGVPPSTPQHAQVDFFGTLAANGSYMLISNAVTPTFNVQWNKISGVGGTIINPNSQNTNVTGLTSGNYVFEIVVTNTCGVFKDTVNLHFTSGGSLPVKLLRFNGNRKNETTDILIWEVVEEIGMKDYEVQISENGFDFKTTGIVAISNNSSNNKTYDFTNKGVLNTINFYRLKMVNMDGSFAFSNILKLSNKQKNINTLDVMPNPATSNVFIHINSFNAHPSIIEILNPLGQRIWKKSIQIIKGINTLPIDVSNLPRGIFFLKVDDMIQKLLLE